LSSRIERIVLDTNVLVSAFLNPAGAPAQVLTLLLAGELKLLFDERILNAASFLERVRVDEQSVGVTEDVNTLSGDVHGKPCNWIRPALACSSAGISE